jgi:hypothetical protein
MLPDNYNGPKVEVGFVRMGNFTLYFDLYSTDHTILKEHEL